MSKKNKNNKLYKSIRLEFKPDKDVEEFLKKNCDYRHFLYNKCVELVKYYQDIDPDGFYKISKYDLLWEIRRFYEKSYSVRPNFLEDYDYYFRGISECVVDDINTTISHIITDRQNNQPSELHYRKFDPNKRSFRFKNKIVISKNCFTGNRLVLSDDSYIVGLKINNTYKFPLAFSIKESISKFNFDINDVKEIGIHFHNDKWILNLLIATYNDIKYLSDSRMNICGIDLGETNPVVIYDGKRIVNIPKHLEYPKEQIKKYNKKIENCQRIMDRKFNQSLKDAGLPQSKNYYKVLKKFHKYWERKKNIIKDWHFKLAHWIVTHYKNIVVDEFHNHIVNRKQKYEVSLRKRCNKSMYNKSIILFNKILRYMSYKYKTHCFINTADTTNTCCRCRNINKIKLRIDSEHNERIFKCELCGYTIDRDQNAAINCYNLYKNKSTRKLFLELI